VTMQQPLCLGSPSADSVCRCCITTAAEARRPAHHSAKGGGGATLMSEAPGLTVRLRSLRRHPVTFLRLTGLLLLGICSCLVYIPYCSHNIAVSLTCRICNPAASLGRFVRNHCHRGLRCVRRLSTTGRVDSRSPLSEPPPLQCFRGTRQTRLLQRRAPVLF
jgi:hypothetical protein